MTRLKRQYIFLTLLFTMIFVFAFSVNGYSNVPPMAPDDAVVTDEDTTLNVAAPGVLGNDSDPDGDPLTAVLVTDVSNGILTLNADGSFTYMPNLNFFGSESFMYVANDGQADSNIATVSITVNSVNDPPIADPNGPYAAFVGETITFDGSGSFDPDGTIVSYDWDFGDGMTGSGVNPIHIYAATGTYTVTLTVYDDEGATDSAQTTATITAVNQPPICDANGSYTAECAGSPITLDGSGSSDPEGTIILFEWDLDNDGNFNDATGVTTDFMAPSNAAGSSIVIGLQVTDEAGLTDSCSSTIEIIDTTPPDITCPANISTEVLTPGGTVINYSSPTVTDTCDSTPSVICDPPSGSTFPVGTTSVECTATDASGNTATCGLEIEVILACVDPNPLTQGYWHRQCLGVPASEGGLDPGRNGRGPSKVNEPDFVDVLMPAADAVLEDKLSISHSCSEGMDADPPSSKCERAIKQYTALVFNQLSDRIRNSCEVDFSPWGCVSTNVGDLIDELAALINSGDPYNCKLAAECAALVNEGEGLEIPGIELNEIRIDQPSTDIDEYFELLGPAGMTLNGLTYLVIGDGAGGSGVIEAVIELTGNSIPSSGFFVAAENTFTLGSADLTANLNFENSDNVTHMIVSDFIGSNGDDLDTDDDGILDATPWSEIVDCVALIETVGSGEMVYCSETVGPDGTFVPAHVYRCPSGWVIGPFTGGDDSPGAANICI